MAALIGTLFAVAQLVANSEYTVMRASGMSLARVTWSVLRVGIPLAAATFLAGEYVAPPAERIAQTVRTSGDSNRIVAQQFDSGFWFKQDLTFVNIRTVLADMTLSGVRMYEFGDDLRLKVVRVAQSGTLRRAMASGNSRTSGRRKSARIATRVTTVPVFMWSTVLRPSILNVYQVAPERLELGTLYDNIRVLGNNAQKTSRFEIAFWNKVFYPLAVLVMMVLALPFAHFQRRQGGVGFRIFAGTMIGLSFFLSGRLFSNLGVLNDWPPLFSAVFPLGVLHGDSGGDAVVDRATVVNARQSERPTLLRKRMHMKNPRAVVPAGSFLRSVRTRYAASATGSTFAYLCCCSPLTRNRHLAIDEREQRVVLAEADVDAGMECACRAGAR